jgi:hypothetical protein
MNLFGIFDPFFNTLSNAKIIRNTISWVMKIQAIIIALVGLYGCYSIIRLGISARRSVFDMEGNYTTHIPIGILIGCVLLALFVLAWGCLTAIVLAYRSRTVMEWGDDHFVALSIISLIFRVYGELAFVTYSLFGIGGCLFVWITSDNPFSRMGFIGEVLPFAGRGGTDFFGGIELAIFFLMIAFSLIVFFYALAEYIAVQVEIATNTRGLRK